MSTWEGWTERWADLVTRRAGLCLCVGALLVVASFAALDHLEFDASYLALLPEDAPEVENLRVFDEKVGGGHEIIYAIRGGSRSERLDFGRALTERLRASEHVERVDLEFPVGFFEARALWLLPMPELERLEALVDEAMRAALSPRAAMAGEEPFEALERFAEGLREEAGPLLRRTFEGEDVLYLFVRPRAFHSDLDQAGVIARGLREEVRALEPGARGLEVEAAARLMVMVEEHAQINDDMALTSALALILVIALMTGVSRQLFAPIILGVPLVAGVLVTLGLSVLAVDTLNLVSGFMVPVLLGLGIDFSIHIYLRFLRLLREAPEDARAAMRTSVAATLAPCATAGLTTAAAFLILLASTYKGIAEYGLLAGIGVVTTLVMTFLLVPPLAIFLTRAPRARTPPGLRLERFPVSAAVAILAVAGIATALALWRLPELGFYNDFKELRGETEAEEVYARVTAELGGPIDPSIIMVGSVADARIASQVVREHIEAHEGPPGVSAPGRVLSIASMLPDRVEERAALLERLESRLRRIPRALVPERHRASLDAALAQLRVEPWGVDAIPAAFRRRLESGDGEALLVLIWPGAFPHSDVEMAAWGGALDAIMRDVEGAGVSDALLLDEGRVTTRMTELLAEDVPRMTALALMMVLLVLAWHFRRVVDVALIFVTLLMGVSWMLGVMLAAGWQLNLFNVVVLPTVIGMGIDNGVHVVHGYRAAGEGSLPRVLSEVGAAACLASMTTAIGFGAMSVAHHNGVMQVGVLAIFGVTGTFFATTVVVPAVLRLLEHRRAQRARQQS